MDSTHTAERESEMADHGQRYEITNRTSGQLLGQYRARDAAEALGALHADAGYRTPGEAAEAIGISVEALDADLEVREMARAEGHEHRPWWGRREQACITCGGTAEEHAA